MVNEKEFPKISRQLATVSKELIPCSLQTTEINAIVIIITTCVYNSFVINTFIRDSEARRTSYYFQIGLLIRCDSGSHIAEQEQKKPRSTYLFVQLTKPFEQVVTGPQFYSASIGYYAQL